MNKADAVAAIAKETGFSKKDSEIFLNAFTEVVTKSLANGEAVRFIGFGTFDVKKQEERTGVNPQTKEPMKIAARKAVRFKAGDNLKKEVNKK